MGFHKNLDYNRINHDVYMAGIDLCDSRNDGYTQWSIKQDLYKLSWLIDSILKQSPTFVDEEEFLRQHDKTVVWRVLKS